jgi:ketosteroid isomerase-like protein
MSQETVELVHRAYDALNRRDLDAYLALMDEGIEVVGRLTAMEGEYHGHDGIRRWWQGTLDAFPDLSIEAVDLRDLGGLLIGAARLRGHGANSAVPVDQTVWTVIEHRDGKASWWSTYSTRGEALEAVGLRG